MTEMNKADLLRSMAETGYNVGFGAKKHFATYDIVEKMPGWIGFFSTAFGIYALVFEQLSGKFLAATLSIIGICSFYITQYDRDKSKYDQAGAKLTTIFNGLRDNYRALKSYEGSDLTPFYNRFKELEGEYYSSNISKQILFSDWYAHYKFFWQHQIDWIEEQKRFRFWRDKIPLSLMATVVGFAILVIALVSTGALSEAPAPCPQTSSLSAPSSQ